MKFCVKYIDIPILFGLIPNLRIGRNKLVIASIIADVFDDNEKTTPKINSISSLNTKITAIVISV